MKEHFLHTVTMAVAGLSLLLSGQALAQTETLAGRAGGGGGFGGPIMEIGSLTGNEGVTVGGGGGAIFGNVFIGGFGQGAGYGETVVDGLRNDVSMGVGGLWLGYTPRMHKLIHPYSSLKIGWGGVHVQRPNAGPNDEKFSDRITLIQPELGVEVNVTLWLRIVLSGGYRYVHGVDRLPGGLSSEDFRSFTGNLTFRFGGFP
jgi:hypothetical protein